MEVNLPKNTAQVRTSALYEAATVHSVHSKKPRTASLYGMGGDVQYAFPRMWDPSMHGMAGSDYTYSGFDILNFDVDRSVRERVLLGLRNIAKTHPVCRSCIELYSRFPLQGLRLQHNNTEVERFFTELFIEDLDFENYLTDLGKSFWVDGTAFAYGNWSDDLGLWVGEDILDPLTMDVRRVPFIGQDMIYMVPSQEMKDMMRGTDKAALQFRQKYPQMYEAIVSGRDIPMDSDRVTMIANKDRPSDLWGTPVMLRCWNTLRLEDRMNSAMQATADRLYAPLIMFTIGGTLPDGTQYIPSSTALDSFRDNLDAALSSDFRAIVTHQGVQAQEVIRSDRISSFKNDIDMYDSRIFMAWGLSESILKPQNQNYATTAIEFQLVSQLMASYQKVLIQVYNKQAALVAEAQEIYETEKKGDESQVVYERREVWDPEAGDGEGAYVVKQVPKLAIPKMVMSTLNFRDEQKEREFLQALRNVGLPIADTDMAIGVDIDLADSAEKYLQETKKKKLDESRMNLQIFEAALKQDMPIPPDVRTYMEAAIPPEEYDELVDKYRNKGNQGNVTTDTELGEPDVVGDGGFDGDMAGGGSRPAESDEQRGAY